MLDGELYLPESWEQDRERCRAADIPDDVRYRSKWWIALELIGRAEGNGWAFDWFTFDEWYGGKPGFLSILDLTDQQYVGEVPKTFSCRPGRRQTPTSAEAVFSQANLRNRAPRSFRIEQQTGPPTVWAAATPLDLGSESRDGRSQILHRSNATANEPATAAARGVHALERGAHVPGREERSRADAFRGPELCVAEKTSGVMPGGLGLCGAAHDAAPGGKIRR
jgi:hypothetical protein